MLNTRTHTRTDAHINVLLFAMETWPVKQRELCALETFTIIA